MPLIKSWHKVHAHALCSRLLALSESHGGNPDPVRGPSKEHEAKDIPILDFTNLQKAGRLPELSRWLQPFHEVYGLHLVVLLGVHASLRLPLGFAL